MILESWRTTPVRRCYLEEMIRHTSSLIAVLLMTSCDDAPPPPPEPGTQTTSGTGDTGELKGLAALDARVQSDDRASTAHTPTGPPEDPRQAIFVGLNAPTSPTWKWEPPRNAMRVINWIVPAPDGAQTAELVVTYFREAPGNTIDANIRRWSSQFRDGDLPAQPEITEIEQASLPVTLVELNGEYLGMSGGFHKADYTMLVAMVTSPSGSVFIKLLGPNETVAQTRGDFMAMLEGIEPVR